MIRHPGRRHVSTRVRQLRVQQRRLALRRPLWHPAQFGVLTPAAAIVAGTVLLLLPVSTTERSSDLPTALFTSVSAVSLTGFTVVDTAVHWSPFGQVVLLGLMQLGGLGVMAFASLLGLLVMSRLGLHSRLSPWAGTTTIDLATILLVVRGVLKVTLVVETVTWVLITLRLWLGYGRPLASALWLGLFHAVSAFTNAGFSVWPGDVLAHADDPFTALPLAAAFTVGGVGYPVIRELFHPSGRRGWSLHTRLTLVTTGVLMVIGPVVVVWTEWDNPGTLGSMDESSRLMTGWFSAVSSRAAGFAGLDYGQAEPATLLTTMMLMLVGGGSASTAGGIKVTTLAILVLAIVSEAWGRDDVEAFGRRISPATVRQALAIGMTSTLTLAAGTFILLETTELSLETALFEVVAAFSTAGLSTGAISALPAVGKGLLAVLMIIGLVGPVTLASFMALRRSRRPYRYPEARPLVG